MDEQQAVAGTTEQQPVVVEGKPLEPQKVDEKSVASRS